MPLATIPEAVEDYRAGKFVIIVDDEDRENEGDLAVAAEKVTPDHITFMSRHAGGLICLPIIGERLEELGIEPMVQRNTSRSSTNPGGSREIVPSLMIRVVRASLSPRAW